MAVAAMPQDDAPTNLDATIALTIEDPLTEARESEVDAHKAMTQEDGQTGLMTTV